MQDYHHQELSLLSLSDLLVNMKLNTAVESPAEKNICCFLFQEFRDPDTLFFSMILSMLDRKKKLAYNLSKRALILFLCPSLTLISIDKKTNGENDR